LTVRRARGSEKRATQLAVQMERSQLRGAVRAPLLPHEHDESPETAPLSDPAAVQGQIDVARGLVDTERRGDATRIFNQRQPGAKGIRRG